MLAVRELRLNGTSGRVDDGRFGSKRGRGTALAADWADSVPCDSDGDIVRSDWAS